MRVHLRMKCSALSLRGATVGALEIPALETGGSATESSPPQADSRSSGAVTTPARMRRTPIEAVPPETAADVLVTVLTSGRPGQQVVDGQRIDVVVVGEVHHLESGAGGATGVVQRSGPRPVGRVRTATARPRPEERDPRAVRGEVGQRAGDRLGVA